MIKQHPFFSSIDFDLMLQRKIPAPYRPELQMESDLGHFEKEVVEMPIASPND
jgi:hypothetical protein